MNKVKSILLIFAFSFASGQYNADGISKDDYFYQNDEITNDEIYRKNISNHGIEDVYMESHGSLLNLFGRDTIGVVDDPDPDIGIVDDPDPAPINSNQLILLVLGLSYIVYVKFVKREIT